MRGICKSNTSHLTGFPTRLGGYLHTMCCGVGIGLRVVHLQEEEY